MAPLQVCLGLPHTPTERIQLEDNKLLREQHGFRVRTCCAVSVVLCTLSAAPSKPVCCCCHLHCSSCALATPCMSPQHSKAAQESAGGCRRCRTVRGWRWVSSAAGQGLAHSTRLVGRSAFECIFSSTLCVLSACRPRAHTSLECQPPFRVMSCLFPAGHHRLKRGCSSSGRQLRQADGGLDGCAEQHVW